MTTWRLMAWYAGKSGQYISERLCHSECLCRSEGAKRQKNPTVIVRSEATKQYQMVCMSWYAEIAAPRLVGARNDDGIHLDSTKTSILLLQFHQVKVIKGSPPTPIDRGTLRPISGAGVSPTCRGMNKSQGRWENIVLLPQRARLTPWPKSGSEW